MLRLEQRNAEILPAGAVARAPKWTCACVTVDGAPVAFPSNGPSYESVYVSSDPSLFRLASNVPFPRVDSVGSSS